MEIEVGLSTKQAAKFLGLQPGSLAVMRARRTGPPCCYSGSKPVYYIGALREWQRLCTAERTKHLPNGQASDQAESIT